MTETAGARTGSTADALPREDGDANGEAEILVWNGRVADPSERSEGLVEDKAPFPGPYEVAGAGFEPGTSVMSSAPERDFAFIGLR
jgi:hypothetical protein